MAAARSACGFCCREALRAQNRLIYEASHYQHYPTCDALVTAIEDRHPRASTHLLVIPRQHIPSVDDLTPEHLDLLQHMMATGTQLLANEGYEPGSSDLRLGFHRPPFASVRHLHLHCLGAPFTPSWNRLRFTETFLRSYVSAESVRALLMASEASGKS